MLKYSWLLISLLAFACGNKSVNSLQNTVQKASISSKKSTSIPEKKEACEFLSDELIQSVMNWQTAPIEKETMMSIKRYRFSLCNIRIKDKEDMLDIRVGWTSEKGAANKILERRFKGYLENGEKIGGSNKIVYETIAMDGELDWLFGSGEGNHGMQFYMLRKRFDNAAEIYISLSTMDAEKTIVKQQLMQLMQAI